MITNGMSFGANSTGGGYFFTPPQAAPYSGAQPPLAIAMPFAPPPEDSSKANLTANQAVFLQQQQRQHEAKPSTAVQSQVVMNAPPGMTVAGVLFVPTGSSPPGTQPQLVPLTPEQSGASTVVIHGASSASHQGAPLGKGVETTSGGNHSDDNDSNGSASSGSGSGGKRNGASTASLFTTKTGNFMRNDKNSAGSASSILNGSASSSNNGGTSSSAAVSSSSDNNYKNANGSQSQQQQQQQHQHQHQQPHQGQQGSFNSIFTPHVNAFLQQMGKDFTRPFNAQGSSNTSAPVHPPQQAPPPQAPPAQPMVQILPQPNQPMGQQQAFMPGPHQMYPGAPQGVPHFVPIFDRSSPNGQPVLVGHQLTHMSIMPTDDMFDFARRRFNTSSSKYRGVSWHRRDRKWLARTWINGRIEHLGCYRSEEMAALAVDLRTIEHFGESRKELNFPDPQERKRLKEIFTKTGEFKLRSAEDLAQRSSQASSNAGKASSDGNGSTSGSKETSETDTPPSEAGNASGGMVPQKSSSSSSASSCKRESASHSSQGSSSNSGSGEEGDETVAHSVGPKISVIEREKSDYSGASDESSGKRSSGSSSPAQFHKRSASKMSSSASDYASLHASKRSKSSNPAVPLRKKSA